MDLKFDDLEAFIAVYQSGTLTQAAQKLGLTQSALSQKMARIEEVLQTSIFIRHPRKLELTASGERLLHYAKECTQYQKDFLKNFNQYQNELSGVIRIAGFSSVMRSIIIPQLADFMRTHPKVNIEFSSHEMFELENILKTSQADFIVTDYYPQLLRVNGVELMKEEYVIISAKKYKNIPHVFLDHGVFDNATETYFKFLGEKIDYERAFMGDVYSIIDGVSLGLGKAVMSKHLVENDSRFKIHRKSKRYFRPVVLSYYEQSYYGPLQLKILELLRSIT